MVKAETQMAYLTATLWPQVEGEFARSIGIPEKGKGNIEADRRIGTGEPSTITTARIVIGYCGHWFRCRTMRKKVESQVRTYDQ